MVKHYIHIKVLRIKLGRKLPSRRVQEDEVNEDRVKEILMSCNSELSLLL